MENKLGNFEKKIVDFIMSHYNQRLLKGRLPIRETKRLSKSKNDITEKIKNSMIAFEILSEIIRISDITSEKSSGPGNNYIREKYSFLPSHVIESTADFNLIGKKENLEYFKSLQRELAADIFSVERIQKTLESIFVFHPVGILPEKISDHTSYHNSEDLDSKYYSDAHKKYYHDVASVLVKTGVDEIKKNLHPENDKLLIERLDFAASMIRKIDYQVEEIA